MAISSARSGGASLRGAPLALAAGCIALGAGCAPALSSFTPAHVAAPGHVQLEVGGDASIPTGQFATLAAAGESVTARADTEALDVSDQRRLIEAAWGLAVNPPGVVTHLGLGLGIAEGLEVQGRLVSGGFRAGARYQLLHASRQGIDLSAGLGLSRYTYGFGELSVLDFVEFDTYVRWQLDFPVLLGHRGDWFRWWGGPKLLLSTYESAFRVVIPEVPGRADETSFAAQFSGGSWHLGGQLGGAIGYRYVFLAAELTMMLFRADAAVTTSSPELGGIDAAATDLVVYPGLALLGEF